MSANTGVVTYGGLTHEVNQYYDSVVVQLPGTGHTKTTKYCFLSRVDPWPDENAPPAPALTQQNNKNVYNNMFVIKRVYPSDMSPMTDRINWTKNAVYDYYRDDIDILTRGIDRLFDHKFYVKNKYDQVFKCLWNGPRSIEYPNGVPATDEPWFAPGQISETLVYTGTDGYKWIFMYTIEGNRKQKFLDVDWMPTPTANTAGFGANTVNSGNIPVACVFNGGNNYYATNTTISIVGANTTQAMASLVINNGIITDVNISTPGSGYISANVVITSPTGTGANVAAFVSPPNGHGSDPFEELGVSHIMVTQTFSGDEANLIPTDIKYRQLGFIINPSAPSSYPYQCEKPIYDLSTNIITSNGPVNYISDEILYQSADRTIANATFTATCLDFLPKENRLRVINTVGVANTNMSIIGQISSSDRTVLSVTPVDFTMYSGYITYIENRQGTQRSPDGSEQVRLIVGF
jgi:hypothetical protein